MGAKVLVQQANTDSDLCVMSHANVPDTCSLDPTVDIEQYLASVGWLDDATVNAILDAHRSKVAVRRPAEQPSDN